MKEFEIILVDDSPEDTDLALRELRKCNLVNSIRTFENGQQAYDFIMEHATDGIPRMVLLDLNMPVMDGLEFIQRIKADEKTKGIPIAVLTSTTELPDIKESLRMGVKSYIPKPIVIEDVVKIAVDMGYHIQIVRKD
ncbi:MAG: response regulator [Bacteroidota bacterium]